MKAAKTAITKKKTHPYVFQRRGAGRVKYIVLVTRSKVNHRPMPEERQTLEHLRLYQSLTTP